MMKRALAIIVFACCTQAADAADTSAAPPKVQSGRPSVDVLRKVAEKIGECVAGNQSLHGKAVTFVLSGKASDGNTLAIVGCFAKALAAENVHNYALGTYSTFAMRSLVADGLVRVDFANQGPTDFSAVPPLKPSPRNEDDAVDPAVQKARALADQVGECAARVSPGGVRQLALTEAASDAEMTQVRGLVPTFAQCLPPGVQLSFPPSILRDASVLAYARLAFTLAASGGGRK